MVTIDTIIVIYIYQVWKQILVWVLRPLLISEEKNSIIHFIVT